MLVWTWRATCLGGRSLSSCSEYSIVAVPRPPPPEVPRCARAAVIADVRGIFTDFGRQAGVRPVGRSQVVLPLTEGVEPPFPVPRAFLNSTTSGKSPKGAASRFARYCGFEGVGKAVGTSTRGAAEAPVDASADTAVGIPPRAPASAHRSVGRLRCYLARCGSRSGERGPSRSRWPGFGMRYQSCPDSTNERRANRCGASRATEEDRLG
jgi:hypothetical protein